MTVRDVKMFLAISRDLSIDKKQRGIEPLSNFTLSDKREKMENFDHYLSPDGARKK